MYSPKTDSYDEVDRLGFAFKVSGDTISYIGFLYNGEKGGSSNLLHLAFHHDLRRESEIRNYYWIEADIPDERKGALSGAVHAVWLKNQNARIAYGIKYAHEKKYFDEDNNYLGPSFGPGLTCATFVISVLKDNGYSLLDCETWQKRDDDQLFKKQILEFLNSNLDELRKVQTTPKSELEDLEKHIELFSKTEICPRFRPAEVAASGGQSNVPTEFKQAIKLAEKLVQSVGEA